MKRSRTIVILITLVLSLANSRKNEKRRTALSCRILLLPDLLTVPTTISLPQMSLLVSLEPFVTILH